VRRVAALALCAILGIGCGLTGVRAPVQPPRGVFFTNYSAPLMASFEETRLGPKQGKATVFYVQDPVLTGFNAAWGEASIEAAADEGGISTVHHADYELLSVLIVFHRFTIRVYGE
jgi:hypothetical protein